MKEIVIVLIIISIIISSSMILKNYLKKTGNELISYLDDLKNDIEQEESSKEELINKSEKIYRKWGKISNNWSNYVLHEEIDAIEIALIRAKTKIKTNERSESLEEIETVLFLIRHIIEKEKTNLKNIF